MKNKFPVFKAHKDRQFRIQRHVCTPRGRGAVSEGVFEEMERRSAPDMFANNVYSREALSHALSRGLLDQIGPQAPCYFVTVVSKRYFLSVEVEPDLGSLKKEFRKHFRDLSYIAAIDLGFYPGGFAPDFPGPRISWHVHALVWGGGARSVPDICHRANDTYSAAVSTIRAFDARRCTRQQVRFRVSYMLKAPMREYFAYPVKETVRDPTTGFEIKRLNGKYAHRKRAAQTGALCKMANALEGFRLSEILFVRGAGLDLARTSFRKTRKNLRRQQERRDSRLEALLWGPRRDRVV